MTSRKKNFSVIIGALNMVKMRQIAYTFFSGKTLPDPVNVVTHDWVP